MVAAKLLSTVPIKALSETRAVAEARSVFVVGGLTRPEALILGAALPRSAVVVVGGRSSVFLTELHAGRSVPGGDLDAVCREASSRPGGYDLIVALRPDVPAVAAGKDGAAVFSQAVSLLLKGNGISVIVGGPSGLRAKLREVQSTTGPDEMLSYCMKEAPPGCPCRNKG